MTPEAEQGQNAMPCPSCGGEGGMYITREMAIDGGDRSMEGQFWGCSRCNGNGWILVEVPNDKQC